jgi:hypothetical protein
MWEKVRKYALLALGAFVCTFLGSLGPSAIWWQRACHQTAGGGHRVVVDGGTANNVTVDLPDVCGCYEFDRGAVKACNYGPRAGMSVYGAKANQLCSGLLTKTGAHPIKDANLTLFCQ